MKNIGRNNRVYYNIYRSCPTLQGRAWLWNGINSEPMENVRYLVWNKVNKI